jgi:uncharacterized cupin superfamily protein
MLEYVEKTWGYEIWFENIPKKYCAKLLFIDYGKWSSKGKFHCHKIKDETFIVIEGTLLLETQDYVGGSIKQHYLPPETSFRLEPYTWHRFKSISQTGCKFIEASTTHSDDDTYYSTMKKS